MLHEKHNEMFNIKYCP